MKNIKLFEEFEEFRKNDYFEEMSYNQWRDAVQYWDEQWVVEYWESFTESDIKRIMEYFPTSKNMKHEWKFETDFPSVVVDVKAAIEIKSISIENSNDPRIPPKEGNPRLIYSIIKLKDEWYYVRNFGTGQCFKCDQMDGLLEYLY